MVSGGVDVILMGVEERAVGLERRGSRLEALDLLAVGMLVSGYVEVDGEDSGQLGACERQHRQDERHSVGILEPRKVHW